MKKPALFLDRDGVINVDHAYVHRKEDFHFVDGIFELVAEAHKAGYLVVIVTNQAGIGRGYYTEADFHTLMGWVGEQFAQRGGRIDGVYFCPYHPEYGLGEYRKESEHRKPGPGMLLQAAEEMNIDLSCSIMVGDKASDMEAARAAGLPTRLYLGSDGEAGSSGCAIRNLTEVLLFLHAPSRSSPVTTIVVNFNGGHLLHQCITQLLAQRLQPAKILIMDNGSSDNSAQRVADLPGITVRYLGENLGFAAANNRALAECDTELVALLNPDAFAEPDWLACLVAAADARPDVAAFGCRQMMYGVPGVLDGIGDIYHVSGLVRRCGHGRPQRADDKVEKEIFSACAGAALYRRRALEAIGGFDEDYFCYVEDVDLGFRLRLAGYSCFYVPDAVVHHVGSVTSGGRHSDFSLYHGHRNLVWTFFKDMPTPLLLIFLPLHLLLNIVSVVVFAAQGKGRVLMKSKRDAVLGIPNILRKRRLVMSHRRVSSFAVLRMLAWRITPAG